MTSIDQTAQAIVDLINSKPQSPIKDEIAAIVIQDAYFLPVPQPVAPSNAARDDYLASAGAPDASVRSLSDCLRRQAFFHG